MLNWGEDIMKMTITDDELDMLKDILDRMTDACTDEDVKLVGYWQRKIKRTESYSYAGLFKSKHLKFAADKRAREAHRTSFKEGIEAIRK